MFALALFWLLAAISTDNQGGCGREPRLAADTACERPIADQGREARRARLADQAASPAPAAATPGVEPIASGVNAAAWLQPTGGTGAIAGRNPGDPVGAFRQLCAPAHLSYDDPLVYPGRPGASHLHQWFGNTKGDAHSTYRSLRTTGDSTCNNLLNRSAYWIPAMMNGRGKVVRPDYLVVYYKRLPKNDPQCRKMGTACVELPRGLSYVFGYNMAAPIRSDPPQSRWWDCVGPGGVSGHFKTIAEAAKGCPAGARIGGVVVAPDCWNGRDLAAPDQRAHLAFSSYSRNDGKPYCPSTHPFVIPTFTLGAWYTNDGTAAAWHLSSDRMPGMTPMPGGATLHSDWFGAWEDSVLAAWHANCLDKKLSCNSGELGDGRQMKPISGYDFPNKTVLVDPPPAPRLAHAHH